ncbi:MAG TPA: D-isomer specific 2-hydroxyacid dehydrogenase family protein [Acidimicrobiales bacterium]|nr:D-isomer specific 2-hydroxyacid dehydrogenase family protein [Acidimicrobiales bacterium]
MATTPRIAIGPRSVRFAEDAVRAGGGVPVQLDDPADGLVWLSASDMDTLGEVLRDQPDLRWVQLPFAGIERAVEAGVIDSVRQWTCAKGSYSEPVAEHAVALALAGLRCLPERVRARSWGSPAGRSLYGQRVAILGGGGIAIELLNLLNPFGVHTTVVRRVDVPLAGATETVTVDRIGDAVSGALVVFAALALTPATERIVDAKLLEQMGEQAWFVNVARGRHVDTDALVEALHSGTIAGAALDVTDPEPLPDGHPLWSAPNCIVTPHTADTWEMVLPRLSERIQENVAAFASGQPLRGMVDPEAGY